MSKNSQIYKKADIVIVDDILDHLNILANVSGIYG